MPKQSELSFEEAIRICDQFPELLVQEVDFTGGEPLLRRDWPKLTAHLTRLGIHTNMITNGLMLDRETISTMKKEGISQVGISLDGLEPTHDRIRGNKGLFKKITATMGDLESAGIPLTIITTVNEVNIGELPQLYDILTSIGVTRWRLQPLFQLGRARDSDDLSLRDSSYVALGSFLKEYGGKRKGETLDIIAADSCGYFGGFDERESQWQGCNAGMVTCGITCDGKIKGCLSLPDEFIEGDLRKKSLWDIWFDQSSFKYTRPWSENDLGPNCVSCEKAEQCKGGCTAMSYGSTGISHNDPYCFYRLMNK